MKLKKGPLESLLANSFNLSRIFENNTNKYFHVVPGHTVIHITHEILRATAYFNCSIPESLLNLGQFSKE